ncbi:hypothetical protein [Nocardiopsis coralliicola]
MADAAGPRGAGFWRSVNRVVRPVLRSRSGLLPSGLMLVRYSGRRSGRGYEIPVLGYRREPGEVWAFGARRGWVSNLRGGHPVRLVLGGREFEAVGEAVEDPEDVAGLLAELAEGFPASSPRRMLLGLPRGRTPSREEYLAAAASTRIARFRIRRDSAPARSAGSPAEQG